MHPWTSFRACKLTPAETALLTLLAERFDITRAAETLGLKRNAVRSRTQSIREKLGVSSTAEAVEIWKRRGSA